MKTRILLTFLSCILTFKLAAQTCDNSSVTFCTQASIDNFTSNYPGCTELGSVFITGSDITNLNGLNSLTRINSSLTIGPTSNLTNLNGLNALTYVGYSTIADNSALTSLSGLNGLTTIQYNFTITKIML